MPEWVRARPEVLGCRVRKLATGAGAGAGGFAAEAAEEARAARCRRRARMAAEVRRGEKLLLHDIAAHLERLAARE